jgi:hypothetical protein
MSAQHALASLLLLSGAFKTRCNSTQNSFFFLGAHEMIRVLCFYLLLRLYINDLPGKTSRANKHNERGERHRFKRSLRFFASFFSPQPFFKSGYQNPLQKGIK